MFVNIHLSPGKKWRRVIDGLRRRLVEPHFLFIAEYQAELNRAAAEATRANAEQRRELTEIEREIDGASTRRSRTGCIRRK